MADHQPPECVRVLTAARCMKAGAEMLTDRKKQVPLLPVA